MKRLLPAILVLSAVVTGAGAVALAWPAAQGMATGARLPGAGDAAATGAARPAGSQGRAIEVPGLGALNTGGAANFSPGVSSVSCASAGSCAAGGSYADASGHSQGFVAVERHGAWGRAIEVPGLGALNTGGNADLSPGVSSVSCASAGSCVAGGSYADASGHSQGFVAVERDGRWARAIEVPGLGALNTGENAQVPAGVTSVSCASAGSCAAGGSYTDASGHSQGFVAVERDGRWARAIEVPGLGALNTGGDAGVFSVSCASPGNCAAGGDYTDRGGNGQGFVAVERDGRWATATGVPGLGALNKGGAADVFSVSCGAAGSCAAVGDYVDSGQNEQGFVVSLRHGRWGTAIEPRGLGALNGESGGGNAAVDSVSCASAGSCAAVGSYGMPYGMGFVVSEKNGAWGKAADVPGLAALDGRIAGANSVSCASPGNCAAVGDYTNVDGNIQQGFVAAERNGRWGKATGIPDLGALNKGGNADASSVSCPPAGGSCAAGGDYADRSGNFQHLQGFLT
jgi:hypothetical protein